MGTDFIEDALLNVCMKIERVKKVWKGELEPLDVVNVIIARLLKN